MKHASIRSLLAALALCLGLLLVLGSCTKNEGEAEESETAVDPQDTVISLPKVDF